MSAPDRTIPTAWYEHFARPYAQVYDIDRKEAGRIQEVRIMTGGRSTYSAALVRFPRHCGYADEWRPLDRLRPTTTDQGEAPTP